MLLPILNFQLQFEYYFNYILILVFVELLFNYLCSYKLK